MGKETKKNATFIDAMNDEKTSIKDQLKNMNTMSEEVREMATERMKKEEAEAQADELVRMSKRAVYTNLRLKIEAAYLKDATKHMADSRNKSLELLNQLKDGKLTPTQYQNELDKHVEEVMKKIQDTGKERRENLKELQSSAVAYWSFGWDSPFQKINRAFEDGRRG